MTKQSETIFQQLFQFIYNFNSNPFDDFYIMLVFRFIVYIYLLVKLSNILIGHVKPNVKARVLRKFQVVYSGEILQQLDNQDMQQLQLTISNTILNATQQLKPNTHLKSSINQNTINSNTLESQRRSLRNDDGSQLSVSSSSLSFTKKSSKLQFDLFKNQYYDPPVYVSSKPSPQVEEQSPSVDQQQNQLERQPIQVQDNNVNQMQLQEEGESEEQRLSPTSQHKPFSKHHEQPFFIKQEATSSSSYLNLHHHQDTKQQLQEAETKYPDEDINIFQNDQSKRQQQDKQNQDLLDGPVNEQELQDYLIFCAQKIRANENLQKQMGKTVQQSFIDIQSTNISRLNQNQSIDI